MCLIWLLTGLQHRNTRVMRYGYVKPFIAHVGQKYCTPRTDQTDQIHHDIDYLDPHLPLWGVVLYSTDPTLETYSTSCRLYGFHRVTWDRSYRKWNQSWSRNRSSVLGVKYCKMHIGSRDTIVDIGYLLSWGASSGIRHFGVTSPKSLLYVLDFSANENGESWRWGKVKAKRGPLWWSHAITRALGYGCVLLYFVWKKHNNSRRLKVNHLTQGFSADRRKYKEHRIISSHHHIII